MMADLALWLAIPATLLAVELVLRLRFRTVLADWTAVMQQSTALMRDKTLDDDEKQERMAKASAATLGGTLKLFAIIAIALAGFVAVIALGLLVLGLDASLSETLVRLDLQGFSVVVAVIWLWARRFVFG